MYQKREDNQTKLMYHASIEIHVCQMNQRGSGNQYCLMNQKRADNQ